MSQCITHHASNLTYACAKDLLEVRAGDRSCVCFYAAHLRAIMSTNFNIYKASNML